jgi:hypothetical protein
MDNDTLLNPEIECKIMAMNVSDEEIFKSVCEHSQGAEMLEINGGDDTSEEIIDMPSHQDALVVLLILQQYVVDLNDPCACKLEATLADFGHKVHVQKSQDMKPALITFYFTSNCS